jgi:hypothetical protein
MKMTFATLCLSGAVALAFGGLAQAQSSSSDQKDTGKSMTWTGCLREAAGASGEFELTNASDKSASAEKGSATYRLVPGASVSLKEHVGHKVEITGMKEASTGEKAPTSGAMGEEKIKVSALKHVSPTCDAGTTR